MRFAVLAFLLVAASTSAFAQARLTGQVTDAETGAPIPGAAVVLSGTTAGAATGADGRYAFDALSADQELRLVVRALGFETQRKTIRLQSGAHVADFALAPEAVDLGDVVVTARETLTGGGVTDLPGSAQYVGPEQIRQHAYNDVGRVLAEVPGVNVVDEDGYGLRPNVGLRGTGSERSSKITLMEDGVLMAPAPYAAPSAYYFPTVGRMDGLEVRKGAAQVKFGPYTTGGALNLISAQVPTAREGRVLLLGGENAQRTVHARAGGPLADVAGLRVSAVAEAYLDNVDGFKTIRSAAGTPDDFNTGFDKTDLLGKLRIATGPQAGVYQALTLTASYTDEVSNETYLGLTEADFARDAFARYAGSQRDEMAADHLSLRARHVAVFSDEVDLTTTLYRNAFARNWYKLDKVSDGLADDSIGDEEPFVDAQVGIASLLADPERYEGELAVVRGADGGGLYVKANNREYLAYGAQSVLGVQLGRSLQLESGLRLHFDEMDRFQWIDGYTMNSGRLDLVDAGTPGTDSNRIERAEAVAGFVQAEANWGRLTATPGVRVEHIRLWRLDYGKADAERTGASLARRENTVTEVIPGLAVGYRLLEGVQVFGGIHRGFAPPSSEDDSEAERSLNLEAGFQADGQGASLQLVGFYNAYQNLLGADLAAAGGGGTTALFNGGEANVAGLEAAASADLARPLGLSGWSLPARLTYTFTDARFAHAFESEFDGWGTVADGDFLPYVARHQGSASLGVQRGRVQSDLRASTVGAMRTVAGQESLAGAETTDARVVVDLSAEVRLYRDVSLFGRVHNLTDETYVVARRPAGLRPGLPRTLALGVKATF